MFRFFTTDRNAYRTVAIILLLTLFLTLAAFSWRRALQIWALEFPFVLLLLLRISPKPARQFINEARHIIIARVFIKAVAWIGLTVTFLHSQDLRLLPLIIILISRPLLKMRPTVSSSLFIIFISSRQYDYLLFWRKSKVFIAEPAYRCKSRSMLQL